MVGNTEYGEEDLLGQTCYGGLDLANNRDLNSFVLLFPQENGKFKTLSYTFLPRESADRKDNIAAGKAFMAWAAKPSNHLYLTDTRSRDEEFIFNKITELSEKFNISNVAYDRWQSDQLVTRLDLESGLVLTGFGQGFKSMSPATKKTESLIVGANLFHNNNPILKWCILNVKIVRDDAGNVKPSKERSKEKIDAAVSLIMAVEQYYLDMGDELLNAEARKSPYHEAGFFFV
jgi:phage terminase large subunit-like protein